jgi:hypothetical protein
MSNQTWAQQVAAWNAEQNRRAAEDRQRQQAEAQWEQQCLQADRQDELDEARNAINYIIEERNLAMQNQEFDVARDRQRELRAKIAEYNHLAGPPPPPPLSAPKQEFVRRAQPYLRQYGQSAVDNMVKAHNRALAVGLREDSQEYFDHVRSNLELNGGARPEDTDELTPLQAAKASGLSWAEYSKQAAIYQDKKRRGEI